MRKPSLHTGSCAECEVAEVVLQVQQVHVKVKLK